MHSGPESTATVLQQRIGEIPFKRRRAGTAAAYAELKGTMTGLNTSWSAEGGRGNDADSVALSTY